MIIGTGIDLVELDRMMALVEKGTKIANRILTEKEKEIYDSLKSRGYFHL